MQSHGRFLMQLARGSSQIEEGAVCQQLDVDILRQLLESEHLGLCRLSWLSPDHAEGAYAARELDAGVEADARR